MTKTNITITTDTLPTTEQLAELVAGLKHIFPKGRFLVLGDHMKNDYTAPDAAKHLFKLEKPGEYRTRCGKKATILGKNPHRLKWPWVGYYDNPNIGTWADSGRFSSDFNDSQDDILGEWKEPTVFVHHLRLFSNAIGAQFSNYKSKDLGYLHIRWCPETDELSIERVAG